MAGINAYGAVSLLTEAGPALTVQAKIMRSNAWMLGNKYKGEDYEVGQRRFS
jgi:hypothetical protein